MSTHNGWEPDPKNVGHHWRDMFSQPRRDGQPPEPPAASADSSAHDDGAAAPDPREYHPWMLQRGRPRPAMMLELRRYEPRSGLWQGWILSYPSLHAVEYMGERMLSLDFGLRKFVLEGEGLSELTARLQQGAVLAIQEYCETVWPHRPAGPVISAIRRMGMENGSSPQS
jgi:hypothetical protein